MFNIILEVLPNLYGPAYGPTSGAISSGFFWAIGLVSLAIYLYFAFALMSIAKKTGTPNGWFGFIPILNVYLVTQIAGVSGWWTLSVLLPIIPFIGSLAMLGVSIYLIWLVSEKCGKPGWWSIVITFVPIVNLILMGILAWGKK